jgi:peptidoglycan/xylan/chitin deacetylase (PgdA/CDA1 family)
LRPSACFPDAIRRSSPHPPISPLHDEVPVFMFHSVDEVTFTTQMEYLHRNGYQSLTLKEFMSFLGGGRLAKEKPVLLTFDDGDRSWYEVARPLLQRYGFTGVGFLVTHYLQEEDPPAQDRHWLSWPEAREMERSGVMDMQSHTHYHDNIFISPSLADFHHPALEINPLGLDHPWIVANGTRSNRLPYGTPIHRFTSRFAGRPRFLDNPDVRLACVDWVEQRGGRDFFLHSGWRKELHQRHRQALAKYGSGAYEPARDRRQAIADDLQLAQRALVEHLQKEVRHLCYPQGLGSSLAVELSQEAGYTSNFWVITPQRNTNRAGDSPLYVPRIKDDYIFRLPGRGRLTLAQVFAQKLRRRASKAYIY